MSVESGLARVRGVVLDAAGTLIEAVPSVAATYAAAARRQGMSVDPQAIKLSFRRRFDAEETAERLGALTTDEPAEWDRWRRIVSSILPDLPDFDCGFRELWEHFGRAAAWRCYSEVGPALLKIKRAGMPVLIASNFDARLREVVRGLPALADYSEKLLISSEVGFRKPHPAFYEAACERLGLPPSQVLWVGDDPENDVRGPRRAGFVSLLLNRHGTTCPGLPSLPDLDALIGLLLA
jgi:putative hydrolase of the HAD superfamily